MSDIKKMIYRVDLPFENFTQPIKTKGYALTLIAKNDNGIKVLKELAATLKSDELLTSCELLNFDLLMQNRADVLIGSTGDHGEVFNELKWWWEYAKDYKKMVEFYDFLEIFTAIDDQERDINKRILELGHVFNVPVLAISNVELMKPNNERTIKKLPPNFNCFDEHSEQTIPIKDVLSEFEYLGRENAEEVVIKNLEKIMGYINTY